MQYAPGKSFTQTPHGITLRFGIGRHLLPRNQTIKPHYPLPPFYFHRRLGKPLQFNPSTRFTLHDGLKGKARRTLIPGHD